MKPYIRYFTYKEIEHLIFEHPIYNHHILEEVIDWIKEMNYDIKITWPHSFEENYKIFFEHEEAYVAFKLKWL